MKTLVMKRSFILMSEKTVTQQLKEENEKLNVNENENENVNENENEKF